MANHIQLQEALRKPYDRILFVKEVLNPVFGSAFKLDTNPIEAPEKPTKQEASVLDKIMIYGTIILEDGTAPITCYEITVKPNIRIEQSKVVISKYIRKLLFVGNAALVNFISPRNDNMWRFSLIAKDSVLTDSGIKEKSTYNKRYTYIVEIGESKTNRTLAQRLEKLSTTNLEFNDLLEAFSVEKLTNDFFIEYREHYQNFVESITGKRIVKEKGKWIEKEVTKPSIFFTTIFQDKDIPAKDFVRKLLARIVFLYFVQKKGWLGASTEEYKDGSENFMMIYFKLSGANVNFYSLWLKTLFFDTLNNKSRRNDDFKMPDGKKVKVPFLNGGLFDMEDYDKDEFNLTFEPKLFHNPHNEDVPKQRGFLDFLNSYNFTVYEDSPDDHTIAIDPEMLGHIFENLLEDNKAKGTFYTPKEIVHYMCQESLIEYLTINLSKEYRIYKELGNNQYEFFGNETRTTQLSMIEEYGDKALNRNEVEEIVRFKDIIGLNNEQLKKINKLLSNIKVCDPAIGSGAFPMGLLQEIVGIKEVIAYKLNQSWKPADIKKEIIHNSIYGVDIEKGAVDIARLRFWLSLVVDEDKPNPLPNLDYKIMQGDSLQESFSDIDLSVKIEEYNSELFRNEDKFSESDIDSLKKLAENYFEADNPDSKKQIHTKIEKILNKFLNGKIDKRLDLAEKDIIETQNKLALISKSRPNTSAEKEKKVLAIEKTNDLLKAYIKERERILSLKDELALIQKTKIYPFFLWHLWFCNIFDEGGFDIVIGNPPYGAKLTFDEKERFKRLYSDVHMRTPDSYIYFISKAFRILKREGILTYIVPNNLLFQNENEFTRDLILNKKTLLKTVNLGDNTFENADVPTCIFTSKNITTNSDYNFIYSDFRDNIVKNIEWFRDKPDFHKNEINEVPSLVFGVTSKNLNILKKIQSKSFSINDIAEEVASGISTGGDNIFRLKDSDAKTLKLEKKLLKPILVGGDIDKYLMRDNKFVLIYTSRATELDNYPNIKKYLSPYKNKLMKRSESKSGTLPWFSLGRQRFPELFEGTKIIMRQTSDSIKATIDKNNYYVLNSILVFKISTFTNISYNFALAMLNCKLNNFTYKNLTQEKGRAFAEVKPQNVRKLFIPKTDDKETVTILENIVDFILLLRETKTSQFNYLVPNEHIAKFFEEVIDAIVFEIYFPEHMRERKIDVLDDIKKVFNMCRIYDEEEQMEKVYLKLSNLDSPVRNNMLLFAAKSPDILLPIIQNS